LEEARCWTGDPWLGRWINGVRYLHPCSALWPVGGVWARHAGSGEIVAVHDAAWPAVNGRWSNQGNNNYASLWRGHHPRVCARSLNHMCWRQWWW